MRILVLSPYQAHSHRVWIDQLVRGFADIEWQVMTLPARHFHWRIRSNPLHWYLTDAPIRRRSPDLILATSMTDLAALRGVFHRELGGVPSIVYFHENQFAYPVTSGATASVEPAMVNLYSALAADRVVFNSRYNRQTFLRGAERFLARMPDRLPACGLKAIIDKSEIIPVPVRDAFFEARVRPAPNPDRLIWNHRWEHDKGPDRLLAAVAGLAAHKVPCRLYLAGQRFSKVPRPLRELVGRPGAGVVDCGFLDERDYAELLAGGGLALSTAVHDFQGLSVLEAAAAGCVPVLPDRLVYPEWFGAPHLYASHDDPVEDGRALADRIRDFTRSGRRPEAPDVEAFRFGALAQRYRSLFNATV